MRDALNTKRTRRYTIGTVLTGRTVRSAADVATVVAQVAAGSLTTIDGATFGLFDSATSDDSCSITSGAAVLTSPNNPWTAADVGKAIDVQGAGVAGATLRSRILSYANAGSVTLWDNASTTVAALSTSAGGLAIWGNDLNQTRGLPVSQNEAGTAESAKATNTILATGTPSGRTLPDRLAEIVNVKDYGAVGDGVTDDTAAITRALGALFTGAAVGKTVFFPLGTYLISSKLKVPPNVTLQGIGRFSSNTTGSVIYATHNGIAVQFERDSASPYHMGGARDLGFAGSGNAAHTAQKLVELGDSANVDTTHGAWNGRIVNCVFSNSPGGYGVYSAHSQEWIIEGNYFTAIKYPIYYNTVIAACRILNNSLFNDTSIVGACAIFMRQGALGGATGALIQGNYTKSFDFGVRLARCNGVSIIANQFEGNVKDCIQLGRYLLDEATDEGAGSHSNFIEGNVFVNWDSAGAGAYCAIKIAFSANNWIGRQCYQSPHGTGGGCIGFYDGGAGSAKDNVIVWPIITGSNTTEVKVPLNNNTAAQNKYIGAEFDRFKGIAGDVDVTGWNTTERGSLWFDATNLLLRTFDGSSKRTVLDLLTMSSQLVSSTVSAVPAAAGRTGELIYVNNEAGGAVVAFSDGTNWRRVTDRAVIS